MQYALLSETGNREHNEDYVGCKLNPDETAGCFVLCDGLGGHGQGEVASRLVTEKALECYEAFGDSRDFLTKAFEESQAALLKLQKEKHAENGLKTTAVMLLIGEAVVQWGHIGDSRLYFFEKGKLKKRTCDHSVPQMLAAAGEIKEKEIRRHPDRNRLLRVMGMEWDGSGYSLEERLERTEGQAFLLCSDGFWELIEEKKMEKCLRKAKSPEEWLESMEKIVQKNGSGLDMDNFSAVAVFL